MNPEVPPTQSPDPPPAVRIQLPATTMFGANLNFSYDEIADVMTIEGIRYSGDIFRQFGRIMPLHTPLKILSREDGVLVVAQMEPGDADWKR